MVEKARIGVIGAGFIGEVHINGCRNSGLVDVVAIADVNEQLLAQRQQAYGIAGAYTDYNKMLESEKLDGVIIATPDELHRAPTEAAAAAGLPILLEKPLATSASDVDAIVSAVEKNKVPVMMGFSVRFTSNYYALKQRFQSGELGEPRIATTKRACGVTEARRLNGRCTVNDYLAVHDFDYLMWIFGHDIESIYTTKIESRVYEEIGTADHYLNVLKWRNGAAASVFVSWGMPKGSPVLVQQEAFIIGSKGYGHVDLRGQQTCFANDARYEEAEVPHWVHTYATQSAYFANVAWGKAEPRSTVNDGLNAFKLIDAANESVRTGQAVRVCL